MPEDAQVVSERLVVVGHVVARGKESGLELELGLERTRYLSRRTDTQRVGLARPRRGAQGRRAVGVGDVAGASRLVTLRDHARCRFHAKAGVWGDGHPPPYRRRHGAFAPWGGQRSMVAICASSWRSPAAGVRLFSRSTCSALSLRWSAAVFSSTRETRLVPGIGAMSSP
jgi:hypothetical protein